MDDKSYVYFISDGSGAVKIGKANNVEARMNELQCGNPRKMELLFKIRCSNQIEAINVEQTLHKMFEKHRYRNNSEWFFSYVSNMLPKPRTAIKILKVKEEIENNNLYLFEYPDLFIKNATQTKINEINAEKEKYKCTKSKIKHQEEMWYKNAVKKFGRTVANKLRMSKWHEDVYGDSWKELGEEE